MITNTDLVLKPAILYAFLKCTALLILAIIFLLLAWWLSPLFLFFSLSVTGFAWYRFLFIRNCVYTITPELIRIRRGIFFKRTDQVEMYRVKDYIVTQSLLLQMFRLMNVTLKSTDPENPVIWMRGIPVSDLIDIIREHVQEARKTNRIYEIN